MVQPVPGLPGRGLIRDRAALRKRAQWVTTQADAAGQGILRFKAVADQAGLGPAVKRCL